MNAVDDLVAFARLFGLMERNAVCCGTVSVAQCVALQALTEGTWDNASLAAHLGVTKGAATRLIDGLEKRGWVERARHPEDRRRIEITVTPSGAAEAGRLRGLTHQTLELVLSKIPARQRAEVERSIHGLRVAAEQTRSEWPIG